MELKIHRLAVSVYVSSAAGAVWKGESSCQSAQGHFGLGLKRLFYVLCEAKPQSREQM